MPIRPGGAWSVRGSVEIRPKSVAGLRDLEVFSYRILICALYRCNGYTPEVKPSLDPEPRGIFAARAPRRPNVIRLSVVRLTGIERTTLEIEDVDFLDGTPLLGIRPCVPAFDPCCEAKAGWFRRPLVFSYPTTMRFDTRKKQPSFLRYASLFGCHTGYNTGQNPALYTGCERPKYEMLFCLILENRIKNRHIFPRGQQDGFTGVFRYLQGNRGGKKSQYRAYFPLRFSDVR